MVNILQAIFSILSLSTSHTPVLDHLLPSHAHTSANKSIAIVGAGSAGLAALKALLDLPVETRHSWSIVLFEQRRDVGGVWLPDPVIPHPPVLPATPLYPLLHTNTPNPTMTYPGFPFPPMTPLYPSHEYVQEYHRNYSETFGLIDYIRFNTTVLEASWLGNNSRGMWSVRTRHEREGNLQHDIEEHKFHHLIVASGHNHYPAIPEFPGSQIWLNNTPSGKPDRTLVHSIFYREPNDYKNQTVVVVGGGASGRDAASQIAPLARKTYLSLKDDPTKQPTNITNTIVKPRISHFTHNGPVFVDGTSILDVDSIILATGYELRIPFLDAGKALRTDPFAKSNNTTDGYTGLTTNLRYMFPLHEMLFSLSSDFPPTALSFVGLPILIANCPSDRAQALVIAHAIANSSLLPSQDELLADLARREAELRARGFDPYYIGNRLVGDGASEAYQNRIIQFLKDTGAIPRDGRSFVEEWRRDARLNSALLRSAWTRIETRGKSEENKWLEGVSSEEDWANLLERLARWQKEYEEQ